MSHQGQQSYKCQLTAAERQLLGSELGAVERIVNKSVNSNPSTKQQRVEALDALLADIESFLLAKGL